MTVTLTVLVTVLFLNLRSGEKQIRFEIDHEFAVEDPQFLRSIGQLLGPPILPGNKITALHNGDRIFPAMLAAIKGARETITFETYIYWSGEIGRKFSDALSERARAGVKGPCRSGLGGLREDRDEIPGRDESSRRRGGALSSGDLAHVDADQSFVSARKRGVRIELIVPGPNTDAAVVRSASRSLWRFTNTSPSCTTARSSSSMMSGCPWARQISTTAHSA